MKTITKDQVLKVIEGLPAEQRNPGRRSHGGRDAVAAAGPGCVYTDPKTGRHCIAGEVLHLLGVPVPTEAIGEPNTQRIFFVVDYWLIPKHAIRVEPAAVTLLGNLQDEADEGATWGEAIENVKKQHPEVFA